MERRNKDKLTHKNESEVFVMEFKDKNTVIRKTQSLGKELDYLRSVSDESKRAQRIIDVLPQIAWTASESGHIDFFNKRWYEYTATAYQDDLNKLWWKVICRDDHTEMENFWDRIKEKGIASEIRVRIQHQQDYRWHLISLIPVKDDDNNVVNWIGTGTDVHEQVLQTKQLDKRNAELLAMNHYLEHFVHAVAHDLRAPVSNLKMLAQAIDKAPELDKVKLMSNISGNVNRLDETLMGLIRVIDIQKADEPVSYNINLYAVVDEVLTELEAQLQEKRIEVDITISDKLIFSHVKAFLKVIITNVLSNSIEYCYNHSAIINIEAHRLDEDTIQLTIEDNGPGIDLQKDRKRLFRPFGKLSQNSKGMGLGLHIVETMVKRNGGYVEIESELNKGTKIHLFLKEYD
nr:PAS domain-containing sensor histidine kinase [uncultured Carboxylicivirga sp.]